MAYNGGGSENDKIVKEKEGKIFFFLFYLLPALASALQA